MNLTPKVNKLAINLTCEITDYSLMYLIKVKYIAVCCGVHSRIEAAVFHFFFNISRTCPGVKSYAILKLALPLAC